MQNKDNFYTIGIKNRTPFEKEVFTLLENEIDPPSLKNFTLKMLKEERKRITDAIEMILHGRMPGEELDIQQIKNEVGRYIDRQAFKQNR